jgi:cation transport ATPase
MQTQPWFCDVQVNEGRIEVDQSALTGESLPVTMRHGDSPKMGSTITRGEVEGTVEVGLGEISSGQIFVIVR